MRPYDKGYKANLALGAIGELSPFSKWGRNGDTDAAEDVWDGGGDYTGFPDTAEKLEILSSDAADTIAGTGARTVRISNLMDSDYNLLDPVEVDLNGTTAVELDATQTYLRASRVEVIAAGSGGKNAGDLTLRHVTTTTNIFAKVPIGYNQSQVACYTVPLGYKLLLDKIYYSANLSGGGSQNVDGALMVRPFGEVFQVKLPIEVSSNKDFVFGSDSYFYTIGPKSDIKFRTLAVSNANTIVTAAFGGDLYKIG